MEFQISTAGYFYNYEKDIEKLEALGFTFEYSEDVKQWRIRGNGKITINSIEDLIKFQEEWGDVIIKKGSIVIYDDYLE